MSSPAANNPSAIPHAPDLQSTPIRKGVEHNIWPEAVVGFGLALTAGWIIVLGYGVILLGSGLRHLIMFAI
jgi:hypothetical protein